LVWVLNLLGWFKVYVEMLVTKYATWSLKSSLAIEFLIYMVGSKFINKCWLRSYATWSLKSILAIEFLRRHGIAYWCISPIWWFSHFLDLIWLGYLILAVWFFFFFSESKKSNDLISFVDYRVLISQILCNTTLLNR